MRATGAALLLLAGCTVGPNFHRPAPETSPFQPPATDLAARTYGGAVDARWWDGFHDTELSSLVTRLARQNLDLAAAAERITAARAERKIARAAGLPAINGEAQYQRRRISPNGTSALVEPTPGAPLEFDYYEPQLTASWELDLFGRVRRAVEAADANTTAAIEARHGVALSAIAELAQDYFELRASQAEEALLRRNLALADQRRALVRDRFANGVATTLDVAQADAQSLGIAQDLPTLHANQARLTNAIGLLLAEPPRALADELGAVTPLPPVPPAVPIGLPSELARRRPDVREAEARLHAATANTGVAVASFYPSVSLGGNFGLESIFLSKLLSFDSRQFAFGPTFNVPLFEGGRLRGELRLREAEQREAAIAYRQTVLEAFHEVDDALTAFAEAQRRETAARATLVADQRALVAADQQYAQGVTTFLDVTTAQEGVLRGDEAVTQAQAQVDERLVALFRALGGGWQVADPIEAGALK